MRLENEGWNLDATDGDVWHRKAGGMDITVGFDGCWKTAIASAAGANMVQICEEYATNLDVALQLAARWEKNSPGFADSFATPDNILVHTNSGTILQ